MKSTEIKDNQIKADHRQVGPPETKHTDKQQSRYKKAQQTTKPNKAHTHQNMGQNTKHKQPRTTILTDGNPTNSEMMTGL
jgi:hypothetical protein